MTVPYAAYILFAKRYHWTQAEVDATDAHVIDALLLSWQAEADQRREDAVVERLKGGVGTARPRVRGRH